MKTSDLFPAGLLALALLSFSPLAAQNLDYARQLSGSGDGLSEFNFSATDDSGYAYLVMNGGTSAITVPGSGNHWLGKFDANGVCVWATRLGEPVTVLGAIAVGGGNVYVGGWTIDDATMGLGFGGEPPGFDSLQDGFREGFIVRFDAATGDRLNGTYMSNGGGGSQHVDGLAYASGSLYVVGSDNGGAIHLMDAFDSVPNANQGKHDPFCMKFNADLTSLEWSSYLPGGGRGARAFGVAANGANVYAVGRTLSSLTGFPSGGFQESSAGGKLEAWVVRIDDAGPTLVGGTYLGGSKADEARDVTVDASGSVWVTGATESSTFPTSDGSSKSGASDAFLVRLDPTLGPSGFFGTVVGGSSREIGYGVAEAGGKIYVAGGSESADFPVTNSTGHAGSSDAFVARFDSAGAPLESGLVGGSGHDAATGGVAVDSNGAAILGGNSNSASFPLNPVASPNAFIAKVSFGPPPPGITVTPTSGLVTDEDGGTDTFSVVLDTEPTANVTIGISSDTPAEGTVSVSSLTFTPSNWSFPQIVTVTGQPDGVVDPDVEYTLITAPAVGGDYAGLDAADVTAINLDIDAPTTAIQVDSITPAAINAGASNELFMISGAGFQAGASVAFENGTGPAPQVESVAVLDDATIAVTLSVSGGGRKGTRFWDVRVTNPDSSYDVLVGIFMVVK